jgi:SAM-dependent methyltransferase
MDAHQLEFPDHTFDLCRAERVLRFADDPQRVLNEMVRVVHPGGQVVVFDFDSDVTVVDAPDRTLARRISDILDNAVPQGWMGRQLFRLFRTSGLADITVVPHVALIPFALYQRVVGGTLERAAEAGALSAADLATWWHALEHAEQEGIFFAANLGFIVSGRKPS